MKLNCLEDYEELLEKFEGDFRKKQKESIEEADLKEIDDAESKNIYMSWRRIRSDKRQLEEVEKKLNRIDVEHLEELKDEHGRIAEVPEHYSDKKRKISRSIEIRLGGVFKTLADEKEKFHTAVGDADEVEKDTLGRKELISELAINIGKINEIHSRNARKDSYRKGERFSDQRNLLKELGKDKKRILRKIPYIETQLRIVEQKLTELEELEE